MSIAGDRLSAEERRVIAESLLTEVRGGRADEVGAHCPFHREQTPGGAFFYNFEIDAAYCHSCGANSDLVGIFNTARGRSAADPDGCAEFVKTYCPEGGPKTLPRSSNRPRERKVWQPREVEAPPALWREKAAAFVEHSVQRLQESPERLAELAAWGISAETALKCRFGWNDRDKWPPFTAWGLPREENAQGKEKKVWLPEGLVMPAVRGGQVLKLKIRRPNPVTPWGEMLKYWEVKGGANGLFHVYGNPLNRVWVVLETERDAALVWQHVHDLGIGAMGNGGASKRPGGHVADILTRARVILNAMDFDKAGATNSYRFWQEEYPVTVRWPAPPSMGKDVGEAVQNGLDIRQWVLDGLPGYVRRDLVSADIPVEVAPVELVEDQPAPPQSYFDVVLDCLENLPLWRAELVAFRDHLSANGLRVYKSGEGRLWVGCVDSVGYGDPKVAEVVFETRQRFHAWRVLDEWVGESSLEDMVFGYFGDRLEVRG
jgi:hypothetical protein